MRSKVNNTLSGSSPLEKRGGQSLMVVLCAQQHPTHPDLSATPLKRRSTPLNYSHRLLLLLVGIYLIVLASPLLSQPINPNPAQRDREDNCIVACCSISSSDIFDASARPSLFRAPAPTVTV